MLDRPPPACVDGRSEPADAPEPTDSSTTAEPAARVGHRPRATDPRGVAALRHRAVAVGAGTAVAVVVVAVRLAGWLTGPGALLALAVLAVAVPTSRSASRRFLLAGAIALGAAPLAWLVDLPLGDVGRVSTVAATIAGGLTSWALWRGPTAAPDRFRAVLPSWRAVDLLPLASGAAAAGVVWSWLRVDDAARALGMLLPGWDNSAHFSMTTMIRQHGVTVDRLPAAGGEHWKFAEYPQGFHTTASAVMEALSGPVPGTPQQELLTYVHALGWIVVLLAVVGAAAVSALPWLRRRPLAAVPAVAMVTVVVAVVPGGESYAAGFPNFVMATVLAACVPLLALMMPRVTAPVPLLALASLLVAVAQGWLLLLVVAGPAAAVVLVRRGAWRGSRHQRWWVVAAVGATVVGVVWVLRTIAVLDASAVLVTEGGIVMHSPVAMIGLAVASPVALLVARHSYRPLGLLVWGPALGVVAVAFLGLYQRVTAGGLSYYFWKLLVGLVVVDLVVVAAAGAVVLARWRPSGPRSARAARGRRVVSALVAVTTVASGTALLVVGSYLPPGERIFPTPADRTDAGAAILDAAAVAGRHASPDAAPEPWLLLLPPDSGIHPVNAEQWFLALTGRWTDEANARANALLPPPSDTGAVADAALAFLDLAPSARIVAPGRLADEIAPSLGAAAERVQALPPAASP